MKLVKSWRTLQELLLTIANTLKDLRNFSLLLIIFIFAYTLFGLEFFAFRMKFNEFDKYDLENGKSPRGNFDGFFNAFTTVFQELSGDTWEEAMYNAARSVGHYSVLYFVLLIILG